MWTRNTRIKLKHNHRIMFNSTNTMDNNNEEQTPKTNTTRKMTKQTVTTTTVTTTKSTVCVSGSTETDTFLIPCNSPPNSPFSINNNTPLLTTITTEPSTESDIQDIQSSRRSSLALDDLNRNSSACEAESHCSKSQENNNNSSNASCVVKPITFSPPKPTQSKETEPPFKSISFDFKSENHTVSLGNDPMAEYSFADCSSDSQSCSSGSFSSGSFSGRGATASWNSSSLLGSFGQRRKKQDTAFAFAEPFQLGSKRRRKEDHTPKKSVSADQPLLAQMGEKATEGTTDPAGSLMYAEVEAALRVNSPLAKLRRNSLEADFKFAVYSTQGQRPTMEDMYQVIPFSNRSQATGTSTTINLSEIDTTPQPATSRNEKESAIINNSSETSALTQVEEKPNYAFFAVYDGHGGNQAAQFVSSKLHNNIVTNPLFPTNTEQAIREGFVLTEKQFEEETIREKIHGGVGTTACVGIIFKHTLYIANVGDSAAILCRKGKPIPLTNPHTVKNPKEKERIAALGGVIVKDQRLGHPLWNPHLINIGVTRAFGDFYFKQKEWTDGKPSGLTAEPEIVQLPLTTDDYFLLLASDGFWDVIGTQQAISLITTKIGEKQDLNCICKELTDLALKRATEDNTTVLLVKLKSLGAVSQPNSNCNVNDFAQANPTAAFNLNNETTQVVL